MDGVKAVSAGTTHSFAIKENNSLWTWGLNMFCLLGIGDRYKDLDYHGDDEFADRARFGYASEPVKVMDDVAYAQASTTLSLAIKTDGSLWAWGYNEFGQLGIGGKSSSDVPVQVIF